MHLDDCDDRMRADDDCGGWGAPEPRGDDLLKASAWCFGVCGATIIARVALFLLGGDRPDLEPFMAWLMWATLLAGFGAAAAAVFRGMRRALRSVERRACEPPPRHFNCRCTTAPDDVLVSMDGNAVCATRTDFVNLQESPAGFGATATEAIRDLERAEREEDARRQKAVRP